MGIRRSRAVAWGALLHGVLTASRVDGFAAPPPSPPAASAPQASNTFFDGLAESALSWAAANGLQMVAPPSVTTSPGVFVHLPISLLPTALPQNLYEEVVEIAPIFNTLVDRISRDDAYLQSTLGEVSKRWTGINAIIILMMGFKMVHLHFVNHTR